MLRMTILQIWCSSNYDAERSGLQSQVGLSCRACKVTEIDKFSTHTQLNEERSTGSWSQTIRARASNQSHSRAVLDLQPQRQRTLSSCIWSTSQQDYACHASGRTISNGDLFEIRLSFANLEYQTPVITYVPLLCVLVHTSHPCKLRQNSPKFRCSIFSISMTGTVPKSA